MGQRRGGDECLVVDLDAMKDFVALFESAENGNGVFDGRLIHLDRLEPALERRIFFDVFPVLVQSRRADAVKFSAREHWL